MTKKFYKKVLLPVTVSAGDYCFGNGYCCEFFDNEDGYPVCALNVGELNYDKEDNVPKPNVCINLQEV